MNYQGTTVNTVNFADGENSKNLTVAIMSDGPHNLDKLFEAVLLNPTNGTSTGAPVLTWISVLDDPDQVWPVDFQISTSNYVAYETSPYVNVTVLRKSSSPSTSIDYTTSDGTAQENINFLKTSGTLMFNAGETRKNITVYLKDDGPNNGDKNFNVTLSNPDMGGTIGVGKAMVTVLDVSNSPRGAFQFDATDYGVSETNGTMTFNVVRSGGSMGAASIDYNFLDGSALNGANYVATNGKLNFADGEAIKPVTVAIKSDGPDNGDKLFQVVLSNPTNWTNLGAPIKSNVTVWDDGTQYNQYGKLIFSPSSYNIGETGTNVTLFVVRNDGTSGTVTVDYTTVDGTAKAGTNYHASSGTLSFGPGETVKKFNVSMIDDGVATGDLGFTAVLSNPTGGAGIHNPGVASVTITDKETFPSLWSLFNFSSATYSADETNASVNVTIMRTGSVAGIMSVDYQTANDTALAGTNYAATSGTLTFGNGETSKNVTISLKDDGAENGDKQFNVLLSNPTNGSNIITPTTTTVTVKDVDSFHRRVAYTLNMHEGWNLISFPVVNNTLYASDLNGTGVQTVCSYNVTDG